LKKMDFALIVFIVLFSSAFGLAIHQVNNASIQHSTDKENRAYLAGTVRDIDTALMVYCQSQINNLEAIKYFTASLSVLNKFSITCTPIEDRAAEITPNTF